MAVVWELKEGTTQPGFSHDLLLVRVPRVENYSNAASTNCFSTYSRLENRRSESSPARRIALAKLEKPHLR